MEEFCSQIEALSLELADEDDPFQENSPLYRIREIQKKVLEMLIKEKEEEKEKEKTPERERNIEKKRPGKMILNSLIGRRGGGRAESKRISEEDVTIYIHIGDSRGDEWFIIESKEKDKVIQDSAGTCEKLKPVFVSPHGSSFRIGCTVFDKYIYGVGGSEKPGKACSDV